MGRGHPGLPRRTTTTISKRDLLRTLREIDGDAAARERVLRLESQFRTKFQYHIAALPGATAPLAKFKTNPFVLMLHCIERGYTRVQEIEKDIRVAKQFSSMETSAGKAVEAVTLPEYGWTIAESGMHTPYSSLDGYRVEDDRLLVATLKSGPACLNDEMSENFADAILQHAPTWAAEYQRQYVSYTYGVLYGTTRLSNKKDWHILRVLAEKVDSDASPKCSVITPPAGRWDCAVDLNGVRVDVAVRIGEEWWSHLGGPRCLVEMLTAVIRASVAPAEPDPRGHAYGIRDLSGIVSDSVVPEEYNVALLQRSQLQWLFFLARHYCDQITA